MVEKQYTDLFEQYREVIDEHAAPVLNTLRDKAFNDFRQLGFPTTKLEDYKYTDIRQAFEPDYGLNIKRLDIPVNPYQAFQCDVPNMSTHLYFLSNDSFYDKELPEAGLPEGVLLGSLKEYANMHPELVGKYYGKLADTSKDGTVAFNTAFVQDGFFLYVPKGVVWQHPIQLINLFRSDVDYLANRRMLIVLEDNTQTKLLICEHAMDDRRFLATQVVEVFVGENAVFDLYELEANHEKTSRVSSLFVSQQKNSNVLINGITLNSGLTRNNYFISLQGRHAETHLYGMAIADESQKVDNFSSVDHAVPDCTSNELFKYVLDGNAVGAFCGKIEVRKDAQKTQAYQSNKNICLTRHARMYTKPQLEIYADDVKCSHGATVGQLNEEALFYLRARGIPEKEARTLLMFAFVADVIGNVRLDGLQERLTSLVDKRLRGEIGKCRGCASVRN
ncbi:MAG: Fe-S cluster assembly protein SufD [Candidatus Azobacteroides sp.]|nr:Fe-S cluster assembly protein SufD [Candidatus Azobacteroides sp.]